MSGSGNVGLGNVLGTDLGSIVRLSIAARSIAGGPLSIERDDRAGITRLYRAVEQLERDLANPDSSLFNELRVGRLGARIRLLSLAWFDDADGAARPEQEPAIVALAEAAARAVDAIVAGLRLPKSIAQAQTLVMLAPPLFHEYAHRLHPRSTTTTATRRRDGTIFCNADALLSMDGALKAEAYEALDAAVVANAMQRSRVIGAMLPTRLESRTAIVAIEEARATFASAGVEIIEQCKSAREGPADETPAARDSVFAIPRLLVDSTRAISTDAERRTAIAHAAIAYTADVYRRLIDERLSATPFARTLSHHHFEYAFESKPVRAPVVKRIANKNARSTVWHVVIPEAMERTNDAPMHRMVLRAFARFALKPWIVHFVCRYAVVTMTGRPAHDDIEESLCTVAREELAALPDKRTHPLQVVGDWLVEDLLDADAPGGALNRRHEVLGKFRRASSTTGDADGPNTSMPATSAPRFGDPTLAIKHAIARLIDACEAIASSTSATSRLSKFERFERWTRSL